MELKKILDEIKGKIIVMDHTSIETRHRKGYLQALYELEDQLTKNELFNDEAVLVRIAEKIDFINNDDVFNKEYKGGYLQSMEEMVGLIALNKKDGTLE